MSDDSHSTVTLRQRPVKCPECGYYCNPTDPTCPQCGHELPPPTTPINSHTTPLVRRPITLPLEPRNIIDVPPTNSILLQFLPSGLCLSLTLERPVVLGRIAAYEESDAEDHIDLSDLNALRHGISRRHCLLHRLNNLILVRDLGSTNGTVLNQEHLVPHEDYPVVHGDRLILGTLNIVIAFSTRPGT